MTVEGALATRGEGREGAFRANSPFSGLFLVGGTAARREQGRRRGEEVRLVVSVQSGELSASKGRRGAFEVGGGMGEGMGFDASGQNVA